MSVDAAVARPAGAYLADPLDPLAVGHLISVLDISLEERFPVLRDGEQWPQFVSATRPPCCSRRWPDCPATISCAWPCAGHELPAWLARRDGAVAVDRAVASTEPMDDGYQVVIGTTLPGDQHLTAVVFVDNNRESAVTSAFVVPRPLSEAVAEMQPLVDDPDLVFGELSPADAPRAPDRSDRCGRRVLPAAGERGLACVAPAGRVDDGAGASGRFWPGTVAVVRRPG